MAKTKPKPKTKRTQVKPTPKEVKTEMVFARVTKSAKAHYTQTAQNAGFRELSDWIRAVLNLESGLE